MFDVGFSEIILLLVIGLLVLGPERLPKVARTLGAYVRKARGAWHQVKYDIDRELQASELKKSWQESVGSASNDINELQQQVQNEMAAADASIQKMDSETRKAAASMGQDLTQPTETSSQQPPDADQSKHD